MCIHVDLWVRFCLLFMECRSAGTDFRVSVYVCMGFVCTGFSSLTLCGTQQCDDDTRQMLRDGYQRGVLPPALVEEVQLWAPSLLSQLGIPSAPHASSFFDKVSSSGLLCLTRTLDARACMYVYASGCLVGGW